MKLWEKVDDWMERGGFFQESYDRASKWAVVLWGGFAMGYLIWQVWLR